MANLSLYARVSTDTDPPLSDQLERLRAWAASEGHTVVGEFTDDNTRSLQADAARPALDRLCQLAFDGKTDMVAAVSLDRLGRSLKHLFGLLREFETLGVTVYIDNLALDTSNPAGQQAVSLLGALNDFDKAIMSERARRGYRKARAKGKRIGAPRLSPSKENRVAALLQAGVCPHRVRTLTNVGKAAIYRIKRDLECKPSDVEQH